MAVVITDGGTNNEIVVDPAVLAGAKGAIRFVGGGNRIIFAPGCTMTHCKIHLGNDCSVIVGASTKLGQIDIFAARSASISIGTRTGFTSTTRIYLHEPGSIHIGSYCLIAGGVLLTNSDMHSIVKLEDGMRINPAADINIADKVWLGSEVVVLKGSKIDQGAIIGLRSVVTGDIPAYSLSVGSPAKVIREGVTWRPDLI